jgi:predicted metalloprotease
MRWQMGRRSNNVEDQRGSGGGGGGGMVVGGLGTLVLALIAMALGIDPAVVLNSVQEQQTRQISPAPSSRSPQEEKLVDFVSVVLADTEDTWQEIFQKSGETYQKPKLVLFSGAVRSACGQAQSAMGPFYCPLDQKVYIDLSFYQDLKTRHNAPGDFAQAYVIAHEVGHHVQTLLGISQQVQKIKQQASKVQANQLSVRQELQADCFAGIWAHHADRSRQILETGDVDEALNAATSIGDDRLQREAQGYIVPESFTHGTSAQRVRWFTRGLDSGDLKDCNTFKAKTL